MRARLVLVLLLAATVLSGLGLGLTGAEAATTPAAYADRLVALINSARAQHGAGALTVAAGTSEVATAWTGQQDRNGSLEHNPDLAAQLESHGSARWTIYGENVGEAPSKDADQLFQAYMNSPEHRDNILNGRYRFVGVGVVFDGSTTWNTLDFVDAYATTATAHTATAPRTVRRSAAPAPRPAPTAAAPTRAATTTTTTVARPPRPAPVRTHHRRARHHAAPLAPQVRAVLVDQPSLSAAPVSTTAVASTPLAVPAVPRAPRPAAPVVAAVLLVLAVATGWWRVASAR